MKKELNTTMTKVINLEDNITTKDNCSISAEPKTGLDTEIIITARNGRYDGELRVNKYKNKTVLNGRSFLLEKAFGITPNIAQHNFINDNVLGEYDPTTGADYTSGLTQVNNSPLSIMPRNNLELWNKRSVDYWCAGDGAVNRSIPNQSWSAHITDTKLYHMIPFRFIEASRTLPDEVRKLYKMEVVYGPDSPYYGYKGYYLKKIVKEAPSNSSIGLNMVVDKNPYTPKWSDTVTDLENNTYDTSFKGDKTQKTYVDMTMQVLSEEFKEWFEFTDKTLSNATISEIGLILGLDARLTSSGNLEAIKDIDTGVTGYDTIAMRSEIYDAELFAKLTFDPYQVSRENSLITFNYRVLA
jgi:hypothetical protein